MGYSIGVEVRNGVLRDRMLRFVNREHRPHGIIRGQRELPQYSTEPRDEVSYSLPGQRIIGIDYGSGLFGFEREFVYTWIRWIALKVGKGRKAFDSPACAFSKAVPCLLTEEAVWPILVKPVNAVPANLAEFCTDALGVPLVPDECPSRRELSTREWDSLRAEMERLDQRWAKVVR